MERAIVENLEILSFLIRMNIVSAIKGAKKSGINWFVCSGLIKLDRKLLTL